MDYLCDADVQPRNEYALRFSVAAKPAPVLEYVKTISSLIGASHILAVFKENDAIKVYFDDKKSVDTLLKCGIHVMGHHIRVDYVMPPGMKVILSNVDPVVRNIDLVNLLSLYGTVMSPVLRSPISDDAELCHIDCGVRYVYITLNGSIPEAIQFNYGDQDCIIKIKVEDTSSVVTYIKKEPMEFYNAAYSLDVTPPDSDYISSPVISSDNALDNDDVDPVIADVQSAATENNEDTNVVASQSAVEKDHINYRSQLSRTRQTKYVMKPKVPKKVRQNIQYKWANTRKVKPSRKLKPRKNLVRQVKKPISSQSSILQSFSHSSSSNTDISTSTASINNDDAKVKSSKYIFSNEEFKMFIRDVKRHRAPLELVKGYFGNNLNDNVLLSLIEQLNEYKSRTVNVPMKVRINRLIRKLRGALENDS